MPKKSFIPPRPYFFPKQVARTVINTPISPGPVLVPYTPPTPPPPSGAFSSAFSNAFNI
jgi:hypothetical protein